MSDDPALAWPLTALRLRLPSRHLELRPASDADALIMGRLVHDLLPTHERHFTPGLSSRLGATPELTARAFLQRTWFHRGQLNPEMWSIPFAVVLDGEVVGMQSVMAEGFAADRTVRSGSFLAPATRGRGIGTAMRALAIEFCLGRLGARTMLTGHMVDNLASQRVSETLGYEFVAIEQQEFDGAHYEKHVRALSAERWAQTKPIWMNQAEFEGIAGVRDLLGAAPAG